MIPSKFMAREEFDDNRSTNAFLAKRRRCVWASV
jgi:hypothetical protein